MPRECARQKDAMQCTMIQKLVNELDYAIRVVIVPTVREQDGLALSSRNVVSRKNLR
jgi:pantoate--beta-alanine ligase